MSLLALSLVYTLCSMNRDERINMRCVTLVTRIRKPVDRVGSLFISCAFETVSNCQ